jgi:hypothetical protein
MADEANNCWRRPYDPRADEGTLEHYLRWEFDLVHEIEREGTAASELTPWRIVYLRCCMKLIEDLLWDAASEQT